MQASSKVLVVGTTADYVEWIRLSCPGRALFITDPAIRQKAQEPKPSPAEEIQCELSGADRVGRALRQHLSDHALHLAGVAAFDCESMELASVLAQEYSLPYPSVETIQKCRNKYLSKVLWKRQGLDTPIHGPIRSSPEAGAFSRHLGGPCVLKPVGGSGSELIFRCDDQQACETGFEKIRNGLEQRRTNRLYKSMSEDDPVVLAEEIIEGNEFSCDFIMDDGQAHIIRMTRKIIASKGPFGTARGYLLSATPPDEIAEQDLRHTLYESAAALGLTRALCMVDFIVRDGRVVLLELAPRPGGDCLPFLLRRCWNLDMLKLFLDFSECKPLRFEKPKEARTCLGLRLHAPHGGILKKIDVSRLRHDPQVREIYLPRKPGHRIVMPPNDYDSWLLGHIIIEPDGEEFLEAQCQALLDKLVIELGT